MAKKLLDNGMVEETIVKQYPRYTGFIRPAEDLSHSITNDFVVNNKIWITSSEREGFRCVFDTQEDWEPVSGSIEECIVSFQKYLDETCGKDKYEAYAFNAYIHSAVSFSISKTEDNRCRWDSGTIGFVGINKEAYTNVNINQLASEISDAWNGDVYEIGVYDTFNEEVVDGICSVEPLDEIQQFKDRMKKAYGVEEYNEKN